MIAELFYPRELKEIIADLRAKDDLNTTNLANLNSFILSTIISTFLLSCFFVSGSFFVSSYSGMYALWLCGVTIFGSSAINLRKTIVHFIELFMCKEKVLGNVVRYNKSYCFGGGGW